MKALVRERARQLGFDDCRFTTADPPRSADLFREWIAGGNHGTMAYLERNAEKRSNPQLVLPGARSIVLLASSYSSDSVQTDQQSILNTGVVARYARYKDYHDVLGEKLASLAEDISRAGDPHSRSLWYIDTGPVLERDLAARAGLGFIGKHTNVISRSLGNWIFLGAILTTVPFEPDQPERNRCGSCTRCLTACPTRAIVAPFKLDARRCISYLTIEFKGSIPEEFRPLIGNRIFGCDDCLQACPWNRFAQQGRIMRDVALPAMNQPDLLDLLSLTESQFKSRFAGTPLVRSKRKGLLRNVCIALGNVGNETALPPLQQAAADPEPLIAEHAQWAIREINARLSLRISDLPYGSKLLA